MTDEQWDFFISYTAADKRWAEWVAWEMEDAGYRVLFQEWDFVPGSHWTSQMRGGIERATRTLAILSEAYLSSVYGRAEWQSAFRADPQGFKRRLVPVRVEDCRRPDILGEIVSFDLFNCSQEQARIRLHTQITAAVGGRAKPLNQPAFPNDGPPEQHTPGKSTSSSSPYGDVRPPKRRATIEPPSFPRMHAITVAADTSSNDSVSRGRTPRLPAPSLDSLACARPIYYFAPLVLGVVAVGLMVLASQVAGDHQNADGTYTFDEPWGTITLVALLTVFLSLSARPLFARFRIIYNLRIDETGIFAHQRDSTHCLWKISWPHIDGIEVEHFAFYNKISIHMVDGVVTHPFAYEHPVRIFSVHVLPRFVGWRGRRLEDALEGRTTITSRASKSRNSDDLQLLHDGRDS